MGNFKLPTIFCGCIAWFVSNLVQSPVFFFVFFHRNAHLFCFQERLDFAMKEIIFDLLSVGKKFILTPEVQFTF